MSELVGVGNLNILVKSMEESGEFTQALSKLFQHGSMTRYPDGMTNKEKLIEEAGDILACIDVLTKILNLDVSELNTRRHVKAAWLFLHNNYTEIENTHVDSEFTVGSVSGYMTEYTETEGGNWKLYDLNKFPALLPSDFDKVTPDRNNTVAVICDQDKNVGWWVLHSAKFSDGRTWDCVNGWRT